MALAEIHDLQRNEVGIAAAIAVLQARFGDRVGLGQALREQHADTVTYLPNQPPDAVIFVLSTQEVQEVVRICAIHKVPIVTSFSATSYHYTTYQI